jgi:opacity protein-like surface antigen
LLRREMPLRQGKGRRAKVLLGARGTPARLILSFLLLASLRSATARAAEDLDAELNARVERDKKTYQAGMDITRPYNPQNEIKYWEIFLEAQPDHVLAPTIRKRTAELKAKLEESASPSHLPVPFVAPGKEEPEECPPCEALSIQKPRAGRGAIFVAAQTQLSYANSKIEAAGADSADSFGFAIEAGYFITDYLVPGGIFAVTYLSGGGASQTEVDFAPALRIYFNQGNRALPYVQIATGLAHIDVDAGFQSLSKTGVLLIGGAGLDVLLNRHVSVGAAFNYSRAFTDPDVRALAFSVGFGIFM